MKSSRYDPADFCVPPQQKGGFAQKVAANIQQGHKRAIEMVVRSGVFPFGVEPDFVRWAIREALLKIDALEPELINSAMRQANCMNYVLQQDLWNGKFTEWTENVRNVVQGHMGRGDMLQARNMVAYCYQQVLEMPDEPENEGLWKQKYMDSLEANFKDMIPYGEEGKRR